MWRQEQQTQAIREEEIGREGCCLLDFLAIVIEVARFSYGNEDMGVPLYTQKKVT
jgi:hypothetical protein